MTRGTLLFAHVALFVAVLLALVLFFVIQYRSARASYFEGRYGFDRQTAVAFANEELSHVR